MPRAGFLTIAGKPNAGKSTLLNRIVGQKLGIVSSKPQSTRNRVVGIVTRDAVQMVILDTPGLLEPEHLLHTSMRQTVRSALNDADVIIHLIDSCDTRADSRSSLAEAASITTPLKAPIITVFNKIDSLPEKQHEGLRQEHPSAFLVSALTGDGVDMVMSRAAELMPESPFLYPEDEISSQPMRFFVAELIRETALEMLEQEVPYGIACEIEEYREGSEPVYIRAVLHVERKSQKGIVVGAGGARIREIGKESRRKIEDLLGSQVYLDLWVKVLPNWRRSQELLKRLGYNIHEEKPR